MVAGAQRSCRTEDQQEEAAVTPAGHQPEAFLSPMVRYFGHGSDTNGAGATCSA
jgi:hypothetical protein